MSSCRVLRLVLGAIQCVIAVARETRGAVAVTVGAAADVAAQTGTQVAEAAGLRTQHMREAAMASPVGRAGAAANKQLDALAADLPEVQADKELGSLAAVI